jgi:hypothetical protein
MVCPTCGLENDPTSTACARCNTTLSEPPTAPLTAQTAPPAYRPVEAPAYRAAPARQGRLPLFAAAAAVLLIAAVVAAIIVYRGQGVPPTRVLPGPGPTLPATAEPNQPATVTPESTQPATQGPSAHDQAVVIDRLLGRSVASRRKLNAAIDLVNRCTALGAALARMRDVGNERQQQLDAVGSADVSALPNGDQLRAALGDALRNALAADQAYVSWTAPTVSGGCANTARRRTAFAQGRAASDQAQAAKKNFLAIWNPIAAQYGLAQRSSTDI